MQNFAQPGNTVTIKAPRDLKAGDGVLVNDCFGVSANTVKSGEPAELSVEGVFSFKRAAAFTAPLEGNRVGFDETTQTLLATGGDVIGYIVGNPSASAEGVSPDDPAYSWVKIFPGASNLSAP